MKLKCKNTGRSNNGILLGFCKVSINGFTAGSFQQHWDLIKGDLVPAILGFLNGGELPYGFNGTSITLIPKVRNH